MSSSGSPPSSLGTNEGIELGIPSEFPGNPVAEPGSGVWDADGLQEAGGIVYDPVTDQYINVFAGRAGSVTKAGATFSPDGLSGWTPDVANPITGADEADDPYIAKTEAGEVYRDASDRALMFTEEKDGSTHRGIELWRSDPNTLGSWALFGRVIDQGASGGGWDTQDVTSPVVIHDGTQLVMLFEGRSASQEGQIGYATSANEGETWSVATDPIIVQGAVGSWNEVSVVPDDLIKVDTEWVLLGHGTDQPTGGYQAGRWVTSDAPVDWDNTSFVEMAGNPYDPDPVVTVWRNNPRRAVRCAQTTSDGRIDVLGVYED